MRFRLSALLVPSLAVCAFVAVEAAAIPPITAIAKDPSPTVITHPTLVSRGQIIRVSETSKYPNTPVRLKVYPETYGFAPTNAGCAGQFFTPYVQSNGSGRVVITLHPPKPLCPGVLYQAEALISTGNVPDRFAHLCVRGRTSVGGSACSDNL